MRWGLPIFKVDMPNYLIRVKVNQIVTKEVQLLVDAGSEEEAEEKAREAIQVYPEPIKTEGIRRIVTNKVHYWIPRDVEVVERREEKSG